MAKVTDLNGCFVRVKNEDEQRKIEIAVTKMSRTYRMTLTTGDFDVYSRISFRTDGACKVVEPKEIYFHDGEFFDAHVYAADAELAQIPWTDGSIDEQEVIDGWRYGDECLINRDGPDGERLVDVGTFYAETTTHYWLHGIGGGDKADAKGNIYSKEKYWLSKPETETERKTRELAEEVGRICFELFGTPAFDCNQDIIDTVEKFVVNGYKKVD